MDSSGFSKGYGFVRFGIEEEQKAALYEMNGYIGLGSKPLKICNAVPKPKTTTSSTSSEATPVSSTTVAAAVSNLNDFSQYYDPSTYWQNSSMYGTAPQAWPTYDPNTVAVDYAAYYQQQTTTANMSQDNSAAQNDATSNQIYNQNEDLTLVGERYSVWFDLFRLISINLLFKKEHSISYILDHKVSIDIEQLNMDILERDRNFYDALESSKWMPIEQLELFWWLNAKFRRKKTLQKIGSDIFNWMRFWFIK